MHILNLFFFYVIVSFMSRIPEIGEESSEKNPLLKDDNLPEFNTITIEKCTAAIGKQTVEFEEKMKSLENVQSMCKMSN